ncbi:hypothetical protein DSECCO2_577430 [anaerobic digester metagenome]
MSELQQHRDNAEDDENQERKHPNPLKGQVEIMNVPEIPDSHRNCQYNILVQPDTGKHEQQTVFGIEVQVTPEHPYYNENRDQYGYNQQPGTFVHKLLQVTSIPFKKQPDMPDIKNVHQRQRQIEQYQKDNS